MFKSTFSFAAAAMMLASCAGSATAVGGLEISGPGKVVMAQACDTAGVRDKGCDGKAQSRIVNCDANNNSPQCFPVSEKN